MDHTVVRDTISVMIEAAYENGIILEKRVNFIPELTNTIEEASDYFLALAKKVMKAAAEARNPEAGVDVMGDICVYMFGKGIEAVFSWADSPDGRISIEFDPSDMSEHEIRTDLDRARHQIVLSSISLGEILFQAHHDFMFNELTTPPGHEEKWIHEEMRKAIFWSMQLGVGHSLTKGYQALK